MATDEFVALAREAARTQGIPAARIATVPHPIGGVAERRLRECADAAVEAVVALYSGRGRDLEEQARRARSEP